MLNKYIKNLISIALCICVIFSMFAVGTLTSAAVSYPCSGVIVKDNGDVWFVPGTTGHEAKGSAQSRLLDYLKKDTKVQVLGEGIDGDGDLWYHIKYGSNFDKEGYIFYNRVKLTAEYVTDENFEKWLNDQKFPESYKPGLRSIHALYPKWVFKADITNIDFQTAVNNEYSGDGKYVSISEPDSRKSMDEGYYNWDSKTYKGLDGPSWVKASRKTVEYYMDPRNFLDASGVFMFLTQSYTPGTIKVEEVQKVTTNTFMAGALEDNKNKTYSQVILAAAEKFKMNPFVIYGLIRQEQGVNGTSALIAGNGTKNSSGKIVYKGYYNYFNVGAYASNGMTASERGLWWAAGAPDSSNKITTTYSRPWNTREKAIMGGVEFSVNNYISVGQDTFYYMDYNVFKNTKHKLYEHQYATNVADSLGKGKGMASSYAGTADVAVEFRIPVFNNMPEKTELPPEKTNNDYYLKNLYVKGYPKSTPTFNRYKNEYELIVPSYAKNVEIVAEKSDANAQVSGAGNVELKAGDNKFEITVTSSSGLKNVYKFSIFREAGSEDIPEVTINTKYNQGDFITGISPNTSVEDFINNLGVKNGTVTIKNKSGSDKNSGYISTADTAYIYDSQGKEKKKFKIVVYGDANCDGKITSVDMLVIQRHIFKLNILDDAEAEAADPNHDGVIKSVDMLVIQRHIFKLNSIVQTR